MKNKKYSPKQHVLISKILITVGLITFLAGIIYFILNGRNLGKKSFYGTDHSRKRIIPDKLQQEFSFRDRWMQAYKTALELTVALRNSIQKFRYELNGIEAQINTSSPLLNNDMKILENMLPDFEKQAGELAELKNTITGLFDEDAENIIADILDKVNLTKQKVRALVYNDMGEKQYRQLISKETRDMDLVYQDLVRLHKELVKSFQQRFSEN